MPDELDRPPGPHASRGLRQIRAQRAQHDCCTAGGPSKLTGFLTSTDTRGKEVTNPLFEFDGCFDPGSDNTATGVFYPSLFAVTSTTLTPDASARPT